MQVCSAPDSELILGNLMCIWLVIVRHANSNRFRNSNNFSEIVMISPQTANWIGIIKSAADGGCMGHQLLNDADIDAVAEAYVN